MSASPGEKRTDEAIDFWSRAFHEHNARSGNWYLTGPDRIYETPSMVWARRIRATTRVARALTGSVIGWGFFAATMVAVAWGIVTLMTVAGFHGQ